MIRCISTMFIAEDHRRLLQPTGGCRSRTRVAEMLQLFAGSIGRGRLSQLQAAGRRHIGFGPWTRPYSIPT
jgi:hypothetical protein